MKKLFCFLAVAATAAFTSCSSDDDSGNDNPPVEEVTGITLTSNTVTGVVGDEFTFTVINNLDADVTSSSIIYVDDVAIDGNTFTSNLEGTYTVHAVNGDFTSEDITLTVTEDAIEITSLEISGDAEFINIGETITFTATANGDMDVTAGTTFYVNENAIEGNTFTAEASGYYNVTASYESVETDEEEGTIAFTVLNDDITVTGNTYNHSALGFMGGLDVDGTVYGVWSVYAFESNMTYSELEEYPAEYSHIIFLTPVEIVDGESYAETPSADNCMLYSIYDIISGGEFYPVETVGESGMISFATDFDAEGEITTAEFTIDATFNGGSTIDIDYNGAFDGIFPQTNQQGRSSQSISSLRITNMVTKADLLKK